MYADCIEPLTMDYVEQTECNGKGPSEHGVRKTGTAPPQKHHATADQLNWLIYTLYSRFDHELCKTIIQQQMQLPGDKEYLFFIQGLIARDSAEPVESLQCLQKAIDLCPTNPDNFKEIGRTLFEMGRLKQSLDAFLKAEQLYGRPDAQVCYFIGELLHRNVGHHPVNSSDSNAKTETSTSTPSATAKAYFQLAILHGKHVASFRRLATIYRDESNYPKAIEMLESTLQLTPNEPDILTEIGIMYLKINDSKSAFERLFDVTKLNERYAKALVALGAILQSKNDIDGALNKYRLIDTTTDDSCPLWSNIGLCFYKKRKFIASIACLKKAIWMSPLNFNCLYNLGLVYLSAQQYASAYYALATAVNLRSDYAECYMLLGICLKHLSDPTNANAAFERAAIMPDALKNPLIYLNCAIHCYQIGHFDRSQLMLTNLINIAEHLCLRNDYINVANTLQMRLPGTESLAEGNGVLTIVGESGNIEEFEIGDEPSHQATTE